MRVKPFLFILFLMISAPVLAETLEVTIHGMTCSFCADGLRRNLTRLDHVRDVEVSLKHKKVRVQTIPGSDPQIDRIKNAIIDAGFTPMAVDTHPDQR